MTAIFFCQFLLIPVQFPEFCQIICRICLIRRLIFRIKRCKRVGNRAHLYHIIRNAHPRMRIMLQQLYLFTRRNDGQTRILFCGIRQKLFDPAAVYDKHIRGGKHTHIFRRKLVVMHTAGLRAAQTLKRHSLTVSDNVFCSDIHWIKRRYNGKIIVCAAAFVTNITICKHNACHCQKKKHRCHKCIFSFHTCPFRSFSGSTHPVSSSITCQISSLPCLVTEENGIRISSLCSPRPVRTSRIHFSI